MASPLSQRRVRFRRAVLMILAGGFVLAIAVLAIVPPSDSNFYLRCSFHQATGLHCPGCGLTRALHSLLNGQFQQALAYNAVGLLLLPFVALAMFRSLTAWAADERLAPTPNARPRRWLTWTIGILLGVYWIARNLPMDPFPLLAPHDLPAARRTEAAP